MAAFVIFTRLKTIDRSELEIYWSLVEQTMVGHPIEVLVPYGNFVVLEGEQIEDIVVAKFPDKESASRWLNSEPYQKAAIHRRKGAIYNGVLVENL